MVATAADLVYIMNWIGCALARTRAPVEVVIEKAYTHETGYIGTLLPVGVFAIRETRKG